MQASFRLNICKHTFGLILSPCEIRPFPPLIFLGLSVFVRRSLGRIFAVAQMRTTAKHGFAAYSLEDSLQKENSRSLTCHISRAAPLFFRDTAVSAFNSFGSIRVCTAEPRPDFRCRSNANDGKALLCRVLTRGLAPNKKRTGKTCSFLFGAGNEIRTRDICLGKATLYH